MRNVAICGNKIREMLSYDLSLSKIFINGTPVTCGLIATTKPDFDPEAEKNRARVLVKVKAFSCNFRDKALISAALQKGGDNTFYALGSEFVGEILAVGPEVTCLQVGDRVIADNHYLGLEWQENGVTGGLPTNHASREYQVLHQAKLMKVPCELTDNVAAAFSIGAQTAYSMVRKLAIREGACILVTAATSNTSLFLINALRKYQVNLTAVTTSAHHEQDIRRLGAQQVIRVDLTGERLPELQAVALRTGRFDYVFDPFYDLYLAKVLPLMAPNGKYVTCGLVEQYGNANVDNLLTNRSQVNDILGLALLNNLHIIGNCIGLTHDLQDALQDYVSGKFPVMIDSVFTGNEVGAFFERTFNSKERLGKVVYSYA